MIEIWGQFRQPIVVTAYGVDAILLHQQYCDQLYQYS